MSMLKPGPVPVAPVGDPSGTKALYADGRTKQAFKDAADINKILRKAAKAGTLSHLQKHGAVYGDFSDVPDLLTAHQRLQAGEKVFQELPSELRKEFGDQFRFFEFVNDPANADRLQEVLPGLAEPGRQLPNVRRTAMSEANPAVTTSPDNAPQARSEAPVEPPASSTT